jgi:hypothetical protein
MINGLKIPTPAGLDVMLITKLHFRRYGSEPAGVRLDIAGCRPGVRKLPLGAKGLRERLSLGSSWPSLPVLLCYR